MWDDVADLFANDATMEIGLQGVYAGKASIRRALNQFGPKGLREGELNDRLQIQTIVHVAPDGRTAKARGIELSMTGVNGVGGEWGESIFENEYVKRKGVWQFKSMHCYLRMLTDYDKGWAKDAKPASGPSKEFPPDRPSTEKYEIFPKFSIVPFHFVNPVTNASPQYPKGIKDVGYPIGLKAAGNVSPAAKTIAELTKRIAEAERLLRSAEAYDASENIASAYGYYLDEFMWDETADLFARDARRDFASISIETSRESIRQSLKSRYPGKKSSDYVLVHQLIQPVIHVARDGQSANMRVRLFQLAGPSGGNGSWIAGIYECKTGIEEGIWKFTAMDLDYSWTADYKGGWAHISEKSKGAIAAPFPKIVDLPFHYNNPVTGRKPPVLLPQQPTWAQPIALDGVPNLHKVSETLYRSSQPTAAGMKQLAKLGIKTVINLQAFHSDKDELRGTNLIGEHISMKAWHPENEDVVRFLRIVLDNKRAPVLIHCQHGADRTGTMAALYRIVAQGWTKEDALNEMVDGGYGFHGIWENLRHYILKLDIAAIKKQVNASNESQ
jgi:protein tyrosine phosphatase (PTP) superfamily phosphohydrolase (DUF442 family)